MYLQYSIKERICQARPGKIVVVLADAYRLQTYPRRLGDGTCTADVKYGFYVTVVPVKYSGQTIHYYVGVAS